MPKLNLKEPQLPALLYTVASDSFHQDDFLYNCQSLYYYYQQNVQELQEKIYLKNQAQMLLNSFNQKKLCHNIKVLQKIS